MTKLNGLSKKKEKLVFKIMLLIESCSNTVKTHNKECLDSEKLGIKELICLPIDLGHKMKPLNSEKPGYSKVY